MEPCVLSKTFASLPRTTRGKAIVIGGDPKGKNFLYTNNKGVIIRNLEDPSESDVYTEHSLDCIVAQYSPSGFYICSGDAGGKVRIWDTVNKEHILKAEYQPLGGVINDIAWTADSSRIAVAGQGREKYAHVFTMDSGNSVGDLIGTSKSCNSVSIKATRPFRLVVASEDKSCAFYEGPPFKFKLTTSDHTNFVNCVRYSPDGEVFVSGGADGRAYKYDGKTADKIGELGDPAHKGGIYALCFSPDGSEVLTCSGDKTCKIFNTASGELLMTFEMGTTINDMQVGCLWQGNNMVSVSLSGYINYLDRNNPKQPRKIIKGHNKPITALAIDQGVIYTAGSDARFTYWDATTGESEEIVGTGQKNQIMDMVICDGELISVSMDDTIMFSNVGNKQFGTIVGIDSLPKAVAAVTGLTVVACMNHVVVFQGQRKLFAQAVDYEPISVAIQQGSNLVAVGGSKDNKVHVYSVQSGALTEVKVIQDVGSTKGSACDLAFSPDGQYLAMAMSDRYVRLLKLPDYELVFENPAHTAKVFCISWSPDSSFFASGSLDQSVVVWKPQPPTSSTNTFHQIKGAHRLSQVTRLKWLNNKTLVTVGQDSHVKQWKVKF